VVLRAFHPRQVELEATLAHKFQGSYNYTEKPHLGKKKKTKKKQNKKGTSDVKTRMMPSSRLAWITHSKALL
jgi:hypothetical protein